MRGLTEVQGDHGTPARAKKRANENVGKRETGVEKDPGTVRDRKDESHAYGGPILGNQKEGAHLRFN